MGFSRDGLQHAHVGAHFSPEEAAVVLAGAQGEHEARYLGSALVHLVAGEVLGEDEARNLALGVATLLVDAEQQLEGVGEDVAAAAGGVAEGDLLRAGHADEVLVLGVGLHVVLHAASQGGLGVVEHPEAPQGVLHHVAYDPLGREELRCGRDVCRLGLALGLEELLLALGVVELVHPAQDLDVFPRALGDVGHQVVEEVVLACTQEVVRQGEGIGVINLAKDLGQAGRELVALCHDDAAEELLFLALRHELQGLGCVKAG